MRFVKVELNAMANPEHLAILEQGVKVWNEWRREHPEILPDLSEANLHNANLQNADLYKANIYNADLSKANLVNASFHVANLSEANLIHAHLYHANFHVANLNDANLSYAEIMFTRFMRTSLSGVDLTKCKLGFTIFGDIDLSEIKGLETVEHSYPSTIGIDTIYKSRGKIPEVFLRGGGVPEEFITYMHSLTAAGKPIQFYSCFISHSSKDQRFCDRLFADLQMKGVRTWYFPEDAKWGEPVWSETDRSIKIYDRLVVVCSKSSLQSGPVLREIERSLNREDREGKSILFPVRIDNYIFDDWQHERKDDLLRKVIGDFRKWKNPEAYQKAFDRLLRDLKAEEHA
jgi:uncharacterized protein YjbI with pentapeptide repeats